MSCRSSTPVPFLWSGAGWDSSHLTDTSKQQMQKDVDGGRVGETTLAMIGYLLPVQFKGCEPCVTTPDIGYYEKKACQEVV